jgi:hypothetical protein
VEPPPASTVGLHALVVLGYTAVSVAIFHQACLAFTAIAGIVLVAVLAACYRTEVAARARHAGAALLAAGCAFAVLAAAPLAEQLAGAERIVGPVRNTTGKGTNLAALLVPNPVTMAVVPHGAMTADRDWFAGNGVSETTAYLGLPLLLALAAICWARRREGLVQVTLATTLVVGVLSLGEHLRIGGLHFGAWLPWRLVHGLPLMASLLPSRLDQLVDLGVAVLVAVGVEQVIAWNTLTRRAVALTGFALAFVPLLPTFHYPSWQPTVPTFFTSRAVDAVPAGANVLLVPIARGYAGDADAQIWQADSALRFAIVGGTVFVRRRTGGPAALPAASRRRSRRRSTVARPVCRPTSLPPRLRERARRGTGRCFGAGASVPSCSARCRTRSTRWRTSQA